MLAEVPAGQRNFPSCTHRSGIGADRCARLQSAAQDFRARCTPGADRPRWLGDPFGVAEHGLVDHERLHAILPQVVG